MLRDLALDRTDRKILRFLQAQGRASNLEVAEAVALSPAHRTGGTAGWRSGASSPRTRRGSAPPTWA